MNICSGMVEYLLIVISSFYFVLKMHIWRILCSAIHIKFGHFTLESKHSAKMKLKYSQSGNYIYAALYLTNLKNVDVF